MQSFLRCLAGTACILLAVIGCSAARRSEVASSRAQVAVVIRRPHWDQVCRASRDPLVLDRPVDVLDTAAIARALDDLRPSHPSGGPDPFVDVAVNYDRSGAVRTAHLQQHNVQEGLARTVSERLIERVLPQARLLEPVYIRVRANLAPRVGLEVLPAIDCMPHVSHERGEPPLFLGGVSVRAGRHCRQRVTDTCIAARLHISPGGEVERIEVLDGEPSLVARVRESLTNTRFDPALLNGEAVPGNLDLLFNFPSRATS